MKQEFLEGERVGLRAVESTDAGLLLSWENDIEIWSYSNTLLPYSIEIMRNFSENPPELDRDKQVRFMITSLKDEMAVGCIDLFEYDSFNQRAGVGILVAPEHRKLGYASEALQLICGYAFSVLCLHQLHCAIPATNQPSIRLFTGAGFNKCGTRSDWLRTSQGYTDQHFYQLLRNT